MLPHDLMVDILVDCAQERGLAVDPLVPTKWPLHAVTATRVS